MFKIQAGFTLIKLDENSTKLIYTGQNEGMNIISKILLKLAPKKSNEKVVNDFVELVRAEALKDV